MQKLIENGGFRFIAYTLFYVVILVLLVLIYGFHDMNAGPFIYTEF
ncbi:teichoic acid D-Ala incorporation-associated protein DltX [Rummeliibacillus pycnus]